MAILGLFLPEINPSVLCCSPLHLAHTEDLIHHSIVISLVKLLLSPRTQIGNQRIAEGVIALGDQGRVKLTQVTEYSKGMGLQINGTPKGKWVCVILTVLDGAEMDASAAFDLAKEAVALDDFPIDQLAGRGVKIDMAAAKAKLVGDIVVFFDVPADYDLSKASVKLNGAVTAVPAAE